MKPVAVLGAGFAGLTAAVELRRAGRDVIVFEAGEQVGGLAASHKDEDGFSYDMGAHFITNRLAGVLGVGAECSPVERYGEAVWLGGRSHNYPFGLMTQTRFVADALKARMRRPEVRSAHDVLAARYGKALTDTIADPLLAGWSGLSGHDLAASVVDKLSTSIPHLIWLKTAAAVSKRAVAVGYCRELPESASVWHVYPNGGLSVLTTKLHDEVSDTIRLSSPVLRIEVENEGVVAIETQDDRIEVDGVFSSAPVHLLPKLISGSSELDYLRRFRYRPMVFVNLKLKGEPVLPDVVTWTPEDHFGFFRLAEPTQAMPWLAPPGHTLITADIGCEIGDESWQMPDDAITKRVIDDAAAIIPDLEKRLIGSAVSRTPFAYPVFDREYEADRVRFATSTGIDGLVSIGRNGEFDHLLMEDVYWRTRGRVARFLGVS